MPAEEQKGSSVGDPFGIRTMVPIVAGIVVLGVGGLYSAFAGEILGIIVGIIAAAVLWAFPFLSGRVSIADFRHSPETILIGSDDRLSNPPESHKYKYLVDGELRDYPPTPSPTAGPTEPGPEDTPGEARE